MGKNYNEPKIEVIAFENRDIITTSGSIGTDPGTEPGNGHNQLPYVPFN